MESQFRLSLSVKEHTNARKSSAKWQPDERLIFVWPGVSIRFYSRVQKSDRKDVMTDNSSRGNESNFKGLHEMAIIFNDRQAWWGSDLLFEVLRSGDKNCRPYLKFITELWCSMLDIRDHLYIDYYNLILLLLILEGAHVIGEIWVWIPGTDHYKLYKRNQLNQN